MSTLLKVTNLKKSFQGVHALKDVSLDLAEGEILGLIGPNGSGKSTFVNTIAGTFRPDGGRALLQDVDVTGLPTPAMARHGVARTFQSSRPFLGMTVLENVTVAALLHTDRPAEAEAAARECIALTGLADCVDVTSANLPVERRRRLDLCRALALKPKVLMLDECLAGLNPREMDEGLDLVRLINRTGVSVIFIEHVMKAVVALCHRVVVLNQGELLAEGSPQAVMRDEKVIRAYLGGSSKLCSTSKRSAPATAT
ncbi:ABC transporter ATP-binding protein [Rhodoplanes sp.]|uniref:ABC transporter ATP-binding protein n=1 Tax=Rhodoplanes sp. TaxID=1968906 RepID=UPI00345BA49D